MYVDLAKKNLQKFTDKAIIMALMGTRRWTEMRLRKG